MKITAAQLITALNKIDNPHPIPTGISYFAVRLQEGEHLGEGDVGFFIDIEAIEPFISAAESLPPFDLYESPIYSAPILSCAPAPIREQNEPPLMFFDGFSRLEFYKNFRLEQWVCEINTRHIKKCTRKLSRQDN